MISCPGQSSCGFGGSPESLGARARNDAGAIRYRNRCVPAIRCVFSVNTPSIIHQSISKTKMANCIQLLLFMRNPLIFELFIIFHNHHSFMSCFLVSFLTLNKMASQLFTFLLLIFPKLSRESISTSFPPLVLVGLWRTGGCSKKSTAYWEIVCFWVYDRYKILSKYIEI